MKYSVSTINEALDILDSPKVKKGDEIEIIGSNSSEYQLWDVYLNEIGQKKLRSVVFEDDSEDEGVSISRQRFGGAKNIEGADVRVKEDTRVKEDARVERVKADARVKAGARVKADARVRDIQNVINKKYIFLLHFFF